jgi:hypothetical protein
MIEEEEDFSSLLFTITATKGSEQKWFETGL